MYQRILIPTNGSDASLRAIHAGIALAKMLHAEVVALSVAPEFHLLSLAPSQVEPPADAFASEHHARAMHMLHQVSHAAREAGVPCTCEFKVSDHPWEAICTTARDRQCDLINMASHGHKGIRSMLLGSQTQKVLVHCAVPVLVQH
ncbi:universal stress protein [Massilia sp. S19_KUP03_FR1]|uniref:universal stress protein n=1 Tax=Massilia sp. S19_KUP03_FR1 TaxID=3025503 RepID=UPI002FCDC2E8